MNFHKDETNYVSCQAERNRFSINKDKQLSNISAQSDKLTQVENLNYCLHSLHAHGIRFQ